jgi:hypothetical protein
MNTTTGLVLSAGSAVKYGCTTNELYAVLRHGLQAAPDAGHGAIPIGTLSAYEAACQRFCRATSELHHQHEAVMQAFVQALQQEHGSKPTVVGLDAVAPLAGLPVVLEIVLEEACTVLADPRFIEGRKAGDAEPDLAALQAAAQRSWQYWGSAGLLRAGGIPAAWVRRFHFPRLLDYRDTGSAKNTRLREQTTDCALMVGGLMQAWHKDAPGELLEAFRRHYGRSDFSQASGFGETELERFFNLGAMLDPATRLLNQMSLWQDIMALAKKQNIVLA